MNGKQSSDIDLMKNVLNTFLRQFGGYFPSRNILQLKETLEVWPGVPQDTVYRIIPNFASNLLRLHTVKNRAAHCWNKTVTFRRCSRVCHICHIHLSSHLTCCRSIFAWNFCICFVYMLFGIIFYFYQYFVTTNRKVRSAWKICFSNISAPLNFLSSVVSCLPNLVKVCNKVFARHPAQPYCLW